MSEQLQQLAARYTSELQSYLAQADEAGLRHAYEFGRKAVTEGLGVLEIAAVHEKALAELLDRAATPAARVRALEAAAGFFAEVLSPFEMALRGFQEANATLRRNLEELLAAEEELCQQNQKLADAHQAVEAERKRYRELFEFAPDGYVVTGLDGAIREANSAAAALFRARRETLSGAPLLRFVERDDRPALHSLLAELQSGRATAVLDWEMRMQPEEGAPFPVALTVSVELDREAHPAGLRWLLRDITERKRVDEERARLQIRERVARAEAEAARRLEFLAEASALLAASLDYEHSFSSVARLAVPYLANWCFFHVVEEEGSLRRVPGACSSSELAGLAEQLADSPAPPCVCEVISTGRPQLVPTISDSWLPLLASGPRDAAVLERMKPASALLVPLVAQARAVGCISFISTSPERRYSAADQVLAEDVAHRCAMALQNARLYRQVIIERDRAEKASRAKDEFVAILSHELRNPLMPILGWVRVFKNQAALTKDGLLSEGVRSMERNAQNIQRIVEDCLDLARISERKITLEREQVDLNQMVEASIEAVRELAHGKRLKFVVQLSSGGLHVSGDRTRLQQVLMNLLTNAIRYTDDGGLVSIQSERVGEVAEIRVQDTGMGIAPDFLEQIFEPFRQGTRAWLAAESGLGLGLAVAKQIVQMHDGSIQAESPGPGLGSTFRLRLPIAAVQPAEAAAHQPPELELHARSLRVLLIEDSPDILSLMKIELEALGYLVLTASDGQTGLELALRGLPQVVVSDIKMPGMDGYELIRRLRATPELAGIAAVALTGFGMKKDVERAIGAGYDAHLVKPVDVEQLSVLIQRLASRTEMPAPAGRQAGPASETGG